MINKKIKNLIKTLFIQYILESIAYSPGHVTTVVQPFEYQKDPIQSGSIGMGFSIKEGVTTSVTSVPSKINNIQLTINGENTFKAPVSEFVIKHFTENIDKKFNIRINHKINLPNGSGFGTSGAAALSLALALNDSINFGLSKIECARIAHIAEVSCRTGLGTVIAELQGGYEVRTKPGAPGIGKILSIKLNRNYMMVALVFGSLSTKNMLTEFMKKKSNYNLGKKIIDQFLVNQSINKFLELSNRFSKIFKWNQQIIDTIFEAQNRGYVCAVALFGETVFSLVKPNDVEDLKHIFSENISSGGKIIITEIEKKGARLL